MIQCKTWTHGFMPYSWQFGPCRRPPPSWPRRRRRWWWRGWCRRWRSAASPPRRRGLTAGCRSSALRTAGRNSAWRVTFKYFTYLHMEQLFSFLLGSSGVESVDRKIAFPRYQCEVFFWNNKVMILFHVTDAAVTFYDWNKMFKIKPTKIKTE